MESKVRGVGYLVGAARRLYYLVHSHRRADGNTGNTRRARRRLVPAPERDDGLTTKSGVSPSDTPLRITHTAMLRFRRGQPIGTR